MPDKNYNQLKKFALGLGADLFGVADISKTKDNFHLPYQIIEDLDRAICIGARLSKLVFNDIKDAPTKLYFHHYKTANMFLDQLAFGLTNCIQKKGFLALAIPASQIIDWSKQTAHLSHKHVGVLAGLGWIGRNNLLVSPKLGAQFRLVTILTNMKIKSDKPLKLDCGDCYDCIKACPVGAIQKERGDFKYSLCFEKLKEFQKQNIVSQYICGICVKSCGGNICRTKRN
jgi:epoxyqueuosine reductase QueG